jgi:hypothetical protein
MQPNLWQLSDKGPASALSRRPVSAANRDFVRDQRRSEFVDAAAVRINIQVRNAAAAVYGLQYDERPGSVIRG